MQHSISRVMRFEAALGAALYRLGRYPEALVHLAKRRYLFRAGFYVGSKAELTFLSMTYEKLGQRADARRELAALRAWVPENQFGESADERLFQEAKTLIEGTLQKVE
jgi:hypothetical protein